VIYVAGMTTAGPNELGTLTTVGAVTNEVSGNVMMTELETATMTMLGTYVGTCENGTITALDWLEIVTMFVELIWKAHVAGMTTGAVKDD
jgi:mRNA-degrading endonuclease toxin of MazEF toxin-antitoxin module